MAYFYKNGNGIDSNAYIYVQLQVTRTDYPTYSHFSVKSVAVSDTGTSSFIRGQVTTNQGGTSWTAATGWKSVSYNGTTTLATASFDVARGASDKTATCIAYAEGGGTGIYSGGTDYATLYVTVPKVLSPNAPTGCTATYVSDSQASVSWTNGTADTDHPRDATLVERKDGSNEWAQVASVSGTASSYTDNGISPNGQYQYRVRAKNAAGYSAYSTSGSIYTTPASPASVTLDKTAATTVQVDATGTWVYAVTYDVELTYDGGATWSTVATSTSLPYSATVSGGTVQFRVRATSGALESAWTLSASLVTVTPPLAPTIVQAPANPSAYGEQAEVAWTPNHPDGSSQESAEIKVTNPGGTSTTYTVTTATSYQLTPNATGTWTAQVRTKGLDPSYGEWSQSVSWAVANPPAVFITSPATDGTDINALPMTVSWTVTDPTGVSTQRIIIEGDGQILNRTLAGDVRTVALNASDVALENGQTYTIRLRVMGGSGLVTEQTRIFDVAWLAPTAPLLQITEGEGSSASIDVMSTTYPESGTVLEASSAMMESLTIHGLSVQDGTPTPSAPVAIQSVQSVNIFDQSGVTGGIRQGTSNPSYCYWSDGVLTNVRSIGAHGYWAFNYPMKSPVGAGKQLFVSFDVKLSGTNATQQVRVMLQASDTTTAFTDDSYVEVAAKDTWEHFEVVRTVASGYSAGDTCYLVIEAGNTGNSVQLKNVSLSAEHGGYIPFGSVALVSETGNIIDLETELASAYFTSGLAGKKVVDGTGLVSAANTSSDGRPSNYVSSDLFVYLQAGTYTFSWFVASAGTGTSSVVTVRASDSTYITGKTAGASVFASDGSVSFTLDAADTIGIQFKLYNATARFMLTQGTVVPTAYEPYSSTATPIPVTLRSLPDGTHDEWISGETADTLVQRVGMFIADSSTPYVASVALNGDSTTMRANFRVPDFDGIASNNVVSDLFKRDAGHQSAWGNVSFGEVFSTSAGFFFGLPTTVTDASSANAWFASNPTTILYPLATPVTTTLAHVNLPYVDGSAWVDAEVTPQIEATFRPVDFPDQPAADSVDVVRVNADGTTWTVASGLSVGDTAIDPLPPLGVPVEYRAVGTAPSGATSSGSYTETIGGRDWVLNFGNAAQEHIEFVYNPQADLSLKQGGTPYHFADGGAGRGLPVFYPTTDRDYAGSLRFDTILYGDTDKMLDLCDRYPVAWLRDPFGHRWRAHVAPSVSHGVGQIWPVTLSWDAMRFEEAWDG